MKINEQLHIAVPLAAALLAISIFAIIIATTNFTSEARQAPQLFGGATVFAMIVVVAKEITSGLRISNNIKSESATVAEPGEKKELQDKIAIVEHTDDPPPSLDEPLPNLGMVTTALLWGLSCVLLVLTLGFVVGAGLFLVTFFRYYGKESIPMSLLLSSATIFGAYILYVRALNLEFFHGLILG